jgi:hypothetical protein
LDANHAQRKQERDVRKKSSLVLVPGTYPCYRDTVNFKPHMNCLATGKEGKQTLYNVHDDLYLLEKTKEKAITKI